MNTIQQIKQACDPDLYVNMLANDPAHIARAKAKAARVQQARRRSAAKVKADANITAAAGLLAGAIGLVSMIMAFLV